jgi:hypothetical protein
MCILLFKVRQCKVCRNPGLVPAVLRTGGAEASIPVIFISRCSAAA